MTEIITPPEGNAFLQPVTVEMLHRLLICDPEAGTLTWRARTPDMFVDNPGKHSAAHNAGKWNAKNAGRPAFTGRNQGYATGALWRRKTMTASRVIWAMVHGVWPTQEIDHINGIRDDDRIGNLREVSGTLNHRNMKRPVTNTSGYVGVYCIASNGKWRACMQVNGRQIHIGCFSTAEAAYVARRAAETEHGFHPNHGRVA